MTTDRELRKLRGAADHEAAVVVSAADAVTRVGVKLERTRVRLAEVERELNEADEAKDVAIARADEASARYRALADGHDAAAQAGLASGNGNAGV